MTCSANDALPSTSKLSNALDRVAVCSHCRSKPTDMRWLAYTTTALAQLLTGALALAPHGRPSPTNSRLLPVAAATVATRRSVLRGVAAAFVAAPALADTGAEVRGTAVTPFNGLAFQYRGSDFGGLKSSDLDEPSVSYGDFMQRLKAGEVKFVEFLAPDGDMAYATFVTQDGKTEQPIRIGEGECKGCRCHNMLIIMFADSSDVGRTTTYVHILTHFCSPLTAKATPLNNTMATVAPPSPFGPSRMPVCPTSLSSRLLVPTKAPEPERTITITTQCLSTSL